MKRILLFLILISAAPLVGCSDDGFDSAKVVTDTNAPPVNLAVEIARANRENKLLLLEFGSSDSCAPCIRFQQEVFSSPEFKSFAQSNLDFVRLDFPLKTSLRPDTTATNELLSRQFDAYIFPTFVALDKKGQVLWIAPKNDDDSGFEALFNPTNLVDQLISLKQKEQ